MLKQKTYWNCIEPLLFLKEKPLAKLNHEDRRWDFSYKKDGLGDEYG